MSVLPAPASCTTVPETRACTACTIRSNVSGNSAADTWLPSDALAAKTCDATTKSMFTPSANRRSLRVAPEL